ncbi:coiled-coil domain-containing protein 32-like [Argiope bruennichi]|uniref:Coiled-coil domain-containing protein 32 n=1 Tax=Argiope bruennichi TaxID=94029 RepID=A0A8T0EPT0_ARGBR|nr:coiled-coil domain-containing protein 32-like [Argiope bruennichi]KAF8777903.1 Coiled-coil domain-containing protein 32 [Argiope bruennichi]
MSAKMDDSNQISSSFSHLPDSDDYIRKLETRLSKVKGLNKSLTSKDMITVLQKAKDDYMSHLISSATGQLSFDDCDGDKEVSVSYVEKKLFPEKNGVTYEELQHLLESDVLAKVSAEYNSETSTDTSVDR